MPVVLGVDLPWGDRGADRFAWALVDVKGRVVDLQWGQTETQFLAYLAREAAVSLATVLLDIPIHGVSWALANGQHFRPVDRALQAAGIPLYPLRSSGKQGTVLAAQVREAAGNPALPVYEVYPFGALRALGRAVGLERWPRYKRGPRSAQARGLAEVRDTLVHQAGLCLDEMDLPIANGLEAGALARLADACDACLAALAGLYWLRGERRACLAGDEERGQMLLLSDQRVVAKLQEHQVPVRFGGQGGLQ